MKHSILCETKNEDLLKILELWSTENNCVFQDDSSRNRSGFSNVTGLGFVAKGLDETSSTELKKHLTDNNVTCRVYKDHILSPLLGTLKMTNTTLRTAMTIMVLQWLGLFAALIYAITAGANINANLIALAIPTSGILYFTIITHFVPTFLVKREPKSTTNISDLVPIEPGEITSQAA